jgi:hypothetical protein
MAEPREENKKLCGEGGARARICKPTMSDEIFAVMSAFPEDWPAPRQHKVNWSPLGAFSTARIKNNNASAPQGAYP